MIPPFDATAKKIGSGRVQVGAPATASTTYAQTAASWTAMAARMTCLGDHRSTSRLATQPAVISPVALMPNATPYPISERPDDVLVDERRRRDVGHQHGERQGAHRDLAAVGADAERLPDPAQRRGLAVHGAGLGRMCLRAPPAGRRAAWPAHRPATVQSIPRQPTGSASRLPTSGASTGATPPTVIISVNALAAARPVTRSAITARPITMPPAPAKPCTKPAAPGAPASVGGERAHHPRATQTVALTTSGRRRPKWSDSGPMTSWPSASPTRKAVSVSCTPLGPASSVSPIAGSPGR